MTIFEYNIQETEDSKVISVIQRADSREEADKIIHEKYPNYYSIIISGYYDDSGFHRILKK